MKIFVVSNIGNHSDQVASAVLQDDSEAIFIQHEKLSQAKKQIEQFAGHWGSKLMGHGEDNLFAAEVEDFPSFMEDLESLKQHMAQNGFEITIGVGEKLSEAGKAFIYAKNGSSDDIPVYHPEMESEIGSEMGSQEDEDMSEEMPEGDFEGDDEDGEDSEYTDFEGDDEDGEEKEDQEYSNNDDPDENYKPAFDGAVSNTTAVGIEGGPQDVEFGNIGKSPYKPAYEVDGGAPDGIDHSDNSQELDESKYMIHSDDSDDSDDSDEMDEDSMSYSDEADIDGEPENEDLEQSEIDIPDSKEQKKLQRQQDEDTEANQNDGENSDDSLQEAEEGDGNSLISPEDKSDESDESEDEATEGSPDISDMGQQDEQAPEDEDEEEGLELDKIRNSIGQALGGFRAQKESLMAMKDQAPELYESTLVLLQTLIQMSDIFFGEEKQESPKMEGEQDFPQQ